MKLAAMELHVDTNRIWGFTERLGRRVIEIDMRPTGHEFEPLKTFPRLFVKALPEADRADAVKRQVVQLPVETEITETIWGEGTVCFEPSGDDPTHLLKPTRILGASFVSGNQVLPWGVVLSE